MGGAVAKIPVVGSVAKAVGMSGSEKAFAGPSAAKELIEDSKVQVRRATQAEEQQGARMRGARRRGRQLLSDARLNPETGMQETLGGGNNLG